MSDHRRDEQEESRRRFGAALEQALTLRRRSQKEVGDALGTTQSSVSAWKAGESEPSYATVFGLERYLRLPPGFLSRHLGYVPVEAIDQAVTVEDLIMSDPLLDEAGKRAVLAVYRELTSRAGPRRGRPTRSGS